MVWSVWPVGVSVWGIGLVENSAHAVPQAVRASFCRGVPPALSRRLASTSAPSCEMAANLLHYLDLAAAGGSE